jgi:hypothetical protein
MPVYRCLWFYLIARKRGNAVILDFLVVHAKEKIALRISQIIAAAFFLVWLLICLLFLRDKPHFTNRHP